jgi:2-phospho-L-lactate guanylyltransferase
VQSSPGAYLDEWTLIVPVKQTTLAKSRLTGLEPDVRRRLAVAFAQDVVSAAVACPDVARVLVVTNDPVAPILGELGADVIPDVPDSGLNAALRYAAERVRDDRRDAAIAALSSDLPSVRASDLSRALTAAPGPRWFVADLAGVGTTMLAASTGQQWAPRFGPGSRAAHAADAMVELDAPDLDRLRRDVDTPDDLSDAYRRGVGVWTADVLATLDTSLRL